MLNTYVRFSVLFKSLLLLSIVFIFLNSEVKAQEKFTENKGIPSPIFDDIPVLVIVEGYGNFYIDVIYTNNDLLYVNVLDLFRALKIPCIIGQKGDSLSGFIENENRKYIIDYNNKQIKVGDKIFNTQNGLIKETGLIYMESSLFAETFGITLKFNYRALSIILKSNFELPIIKLQRIENLRKNISKLQGEETADTILRRDFHFLKLGSLDWSLTSIQTLNTSSTNDHVRLGLGTELLFGEADVSVDYYDRYKFNNRQLQYLWQWVDNDNSIIRQAQVGKIYNQTISYISSPVIGATISNAPTTVRKAKGYYTINDVTEPDWSVELYINNVLVDYTKADASGLFNFKVPNVYGYTVLKLKFYGPMGEERTEERTINIPYTIMPDNEFEYSLSAGIVQDSSNSRFSKAEFNYGVNRILTVGGGLEYLSSITSGSSIPYAKATFQPFGKMTLNAEYDYGVKSGGVLNYFFLKDALLELDYSKYNEDQTATLFRYLEERKVKISIPLKINKITILAKFDYTQYVYNVFNYDQSNITFSAYYKQFSANSTTQFNWIDQNNAYITSNLSLSFKLKNGFTFIPTAQYNVNERNFDFYKLALEKRITKGYFTCYYQRNILFNNNSININFSYDLKFAKTNIGSNYSEGYVSTYESAQGSMEFGGGNNYTYINNTSSVGRGGIMLYPFLDLNNNGVWDEGEPLVKLSTVRIEGGQAIYSEKDSIIRIPNLIAFTKHIMEFSDYNLENMNWRFKNKKYQVLIDPNQFKRIDIPIIVVGEVNGTVYFKDDKSKNGIGRIIVNIFKKGTDKKVTEILSESDGFIDYMGLEPGEYIARVDSAQLSNLDYTVEPQQRTFKIKTLIEGDIVSDIDFVLSEKQKAKEPDKEEIEKQENPANKK